MFCKNCGNNLPDGAKFCHGCGAAAKPAQQFSAPMAPVQPAPEAMQSSPVYSAQQSYAPQYPTSLKATSYTDVAPLSIGQYIVMFLLLSVPLLNIVLLFVWSFGSSVNPNKRNFARASLIFGVVMFILTLVLGGAIFSVLGEILGGYY